MDFSCWDSGSPWSPSTHPVLSWPSIRAPGESDSTRIVRGVGSRSWWRGPRMESTGERSRRSSARFPRRIEEAFGSFENFKQAFTKAALTRFGSGWTWLCVDGDGGLVITSTPNQDNPISTGLIPILGLDVWEHAYYLKYENRRGDYITAWWNIVNWSEVSSNYASVRLAAGFDQVSQWAKSTWNKFEEGWAKLGKSE